MWRGLPARVQQRDPSDDCESLDTGRKARATKMTTTHHSTSALTYSRSLLELAKEKGGTAEAQSVGSELAVIGQILTENPSFKLYLTDPGLSADERGKALKRIFEGKLSPLLMKFVGLLSSKGRLSLLAEIPEAYQDLLDEDMGKIEVDVTVAQKLTPDQLEVVREKVSQALKKDAVIHLNVDEKIIGGMILRVQDKLIDASVKHQLQAMKEQLLAARPK
jgi:F-type H+-transporting ATPase subunit delta